MIKRALCLGLLTAACLPSLASAQAGPYERQRPDSAAVERGRTFYADQCGGCHGFDAKGTQSGADLIRSVTVLRDNEGSEIGPAIAAIRNHPSDLNRRNLMDVSHFLKAQIEATARNRNASVPPNVYTGDATAGRAYFEGAGGCSACHSASGDFEGLGARYGGVDLQQRFLFPRSGSPSAVTVIHAQDGRISGTLNFIDDFFVALTDSDGLYRSFRRSPQLQVDVDDPLAAHRDLLGQISDAEIHDVVTYLGTLQ